MDQDPNYVAPPQHKRRVYAETPDYGLPKQPIPDQLGLQQQPPLPQQPFYPNQQLPPSHQQPQQQYFTPGAAAIPYAPQTPAQPAPQPHDQQSPYPAQPPIGGHPVHDPHAGLASQFGQMNIQQAHPPRQFAQSQMLNLVGLPLDPSELDNPPPVPQLPPQSTISAEPSVNLNPSLMRSTINAVPMTDSLLRKTKLPFGLVISPYRTLKGLDEPVPVVTDQIIARCRRCRTYINPYITFVDHTRWKCCVCNLTNEIPRQFDWDAENGQPRDRMQRAELHNSVVEFIAPQEYTNRAPPPPCYVFLIDVSHAAIRSGMVATASRTILESLDRIPNEDERVNISIIAFDSSLYYFSLLPGDTEPSMLVVSDLDEPPFLPKPTDLLVSLSETRPALENLLSRLNDMFKNNRNVNNAMGAALKAGYTLISKRGGKISVLSASLPNIGPGALKNRDDTKILGTPKESSLLHPADSFYKELAIEASKQNVFVSFDMWLFSPSYTDVATLGCLPRYTAGQTYYYPAFDASRVEDAVKFAHEFGNVISQPLMYEAVIRIRFSNGLKLPTYHGNFFVRTTDLLSLSTVSSDQSYCVECEIEDPLSVSRVIFQCALLHTTNRGERRIRVMTLALPTTSNISEVYASADQVALTTLLANKAVERTTQAKLEDARAALLNKIVDIVGTYKSIMTASGGLSTQVILPANLKFLPLLVLGILKNIAIRESSQIPPDHRAYAQDLIRTLPIELLLPYIHPMFYSLHNMPKECGTVGDNGVILPPPKELSSERFERHGLYLIENGQSMFLWVGRQAVPALMKDVFDLSDYQELKGGKTTLPILENNFSQRINAVIGKIREMRRGPFWPDLYVIKEDGDVSMRKWALSMLLEDRQETLPSYNQWLSNIKDKVNNGSYK